MAPGTPLTRAILAHFGAEYRSSRMTRWIAGALGRLVFSDPARLAELEALVHPVFNERLARDDRGRRGRRPAAVVLEAIKLVEAGQPAATRSGSSSASRRPSWPGFARGMNEADARQRIAAQQESFTLWRAAATRIIHTDGRLTDVERIVDGAFKEALARL
jgi:dephospho-CoA kinase